MMSDQDKLAIYYASKVTSYCRAQIDCSHCIFCSDELHDDTYCECKQTTPDKWFKEATNENND